MPVEVIDLISSPEARPLPCPATISEASRADDTAKPAPSRPSERKPLSATTDDYDVLDLTRVTHDGFIAIPRTRPAPQQRTGQSGLDKSEKKRIEASLPDSDDLELLDGFDDESSARPRKKARTLGSSRPLQGGSGLLTTAEGARGQIAAERGRASARSTSATAPTTVTASVGRGAPAVLQPVTLKRWNPEADPIRTSSDADPFVSSPRQPPGKASVIDLSLDDDPLASSPPLVGGKTGQFSDDNPFASSPRTGGRDKDEAISPSRRQQLQLPSSPLFVNSQPPQDNNVPILRGDEPSAGVKGKEKRKTVDWDHISSSAPSVGFRDDPLDMGPGTARGPLSRSRSVGMDIDLGDLANYDCGLDNEDKLPKISGGQASRAGAGNGNSNARVTKSSRVSSKPTASTKSVAEKELERLEKDAEKRRKQREKEEAKEQRQREKVRAAALAEVNKVRTDKKVSTPEMLIDLPTSLEPSLKVQVETLLEDLSVSCHNYNSPVKNVVKWRRKVRAVFNEAEGHWEPIPERVEDEKHAMVIVKAAELVELSLGSDGADLESHVLQMQRHYDGHKLIYLIEGLNPWMRSNRTKRNRQFQSAVRNAAITDPDVGDAPPPSGQQQQQQQSRRSKKKDSPHVDEDILEDALLRLQVHHGALIHHVDAAVQTAQWVAIFTQHISTIPYRRQRDAANASAAFCMDSGQVRTGDDARDAYVRMLQEIARVTAPVAYGIAAEFGSPAELVRGLEREGPLALENIRKSANKDGAYTDRTVGQAMSRRIWKVFTGTDETSMDI